jgi:hypothetical protein
MAKLTTYVVKHTTLYPGGHAADPGYRWVRAVQGEREFGFYCDPDGSRVRGIESWAGDRFRALSPVNAARRAPDLEAAIAAHLAGEPVSQGEG